MKESQANKRQVGGKHYKMNYETWDFANDFDLNYLEFTAIRYISRHELKNGLEDLFKVQHYLEKMIEIEDDVKLYAVPFVAFKNTLTIVKRHVFMKTKQNQFFQYLVQNKADEQKIIESIYCRNYETALAYVNILISKVQKGFRTPIGSVAKAQFYKG